MREIKTRIGLIKAEEMTEKEFNAIKGNKITPEWVLVDGRELMLNEYTCYGGFDGTCNCLTHPRKSWVAFE